MATIKLAAKYGREDIDEVKSSVRKHTSQLTGTTTVQDWCDDSLDLIDIMCELVSKNKALVRAQGMQALSEYNYGLTGSIASPVQRFLTYWIVFKKFQFKYLPPPAKPLVFNNPLYRVAVRKNENDTTELE